MSEPETRPAWVSERLREEFPRLGLWSLNVSVEGRIGRSPRGVREHLARLADRFYGADALVLRQRPVPHAYRVFYRHIGLDPDVTRVPAEAAAVDRLMRGGLPSRGLLDDALTIAVMETGVPVRALDATAVEGALGLRLTGQRESLGAGEEATPLPAGRIVIADERAPLALLFGAQAPRAVVARETRRVLLYAVTVEGVPAIHVEEALWMAAETLRS